MKKFLHIFQKDNEPQEIEMVDLSSRKVPINLVLSTTFEVPPSAIVKLDLTAYKSVLQTINMDYSLVASWAHHDYMSQSESKKLEPINRFWPKAESLQERAIQFIAEQEIKTGKPFPCPEPLPKMLRDRINERISAFSSGVREEKTTLIQNELRDRINEYIRAFLSSISEGENTLIQNELVPSPSFSFSRAPR